MTLHETCLSVSDRLSKVLEGSAPEMTDEPLHLVCTDQLGIGQANLFGQGLHQVLANIVHGAILKTEALTKPA